MLAHSLVGVGKGGDRKGKRRLAWLRWERVVAIKEGRDACLGTRQRNGEK